LGNCIFLRIYAKKEDISRISISIFKSLIKEEKMKKYLFILFIFIIASSASATVYKWVDDKGVVNFADDVSKVPYSYRDRVEEVSLPKTGPSNPSQPSSKNIIVGTWSGETATKAPPISQTLIREGDFAIKLVEALKIGQPQNEAEAESMLATVGIAPQNGWIADYPVTPDIIGELEKAIGEAADANKLPMKKDEALKAFRTAAAELELPIIAEIPAEGPAEIPDRYAESPSPTDPQYAEPSVIEDYYDAEGPPIVTYYPPPPDYYYLYAWIPSPFWYTGFYFPGFYVLRDFHRVIFINRHPCVITNHFRDHHTGRIFPVDPIRRHTDRRHNHEYFDTSKSIPRHVHERPPNYNREERPSHRDGDPQRSSVIDQRINKYPGTSKSIPRHVHERPPIYNREEKLSHRDGGPQRPSIIDQRINQYPGTSKSIPRHVHERSPIYNREEKLSHRDGGPQRPSIIDQRINKYPGRMGSHGMSVRVFHQPNNLSRQSVTNLQRPSAGKTRSFSLPSRGSERSFSPPSGGEGKQFRSSSKGYRGFLKSQQGVGHNHGFGRRGISY
jgi:hypothetical protein